MKVPERNISKKENASVAAVVSSAVAMHCFAPMAFAPLKCHHECELNVSTFPSSASLVGARQMLVQ